MQISILDLYIGERRRKLVDEIEDLAEDIRLNGQITPITVRPPTDIEKELGIKEPWILVAGGRRVAAKLHIGELMIEAFAREEMDEIKHRVLELHENLKRKAMTFEEECDAKREIFELRRLQNPKITQMEVAKEIGASASTFSRDIKVAELLSENPEMKGSASKKAVIRAADSKQQLNVRLNKATSQAEIGGVGTIQNKLVLADSRDWLRAQPMGRYDLILTDPPYGYDYFKLGQKMRSGGKDQPIGLGEYNDSPQAVHDLLIDCVPMMVRATAETGWIVSFTGQESYDLLYQLFSDCCADHFDYRHPDFPAQCGSARAEGSSGRCSFLVPEIVPWIWYRPNSRNRPRFPERHAMNYYEKILVVNRGYGRLMKPGCPNIISMDAEYGSERIHPNQKPIPLAEELVERFTMIGDKVADPFFGSGALLAGASKAAREIDGCDSNEKNRGPALGLVAKYYTIPPSSASRAHLARNKDHNAEGVTDFSEVEA